MMPAMGGYAKGTTTGLRAKWNTSEQNGTDFGNWEMFHLRVSCFYKTFYGAASAETSSGGLAGYIRRIDALALQIPAGLVTRICPNCGYSLEGLADGSGAAASAGISKETICPECGRVFDPRELVLYGWGRGSHATTGNVRRLRVGWWLAGGCAPLAWWFWMPLIKLAWWPVILAAWGGLIVYFIFRRSASRHPGLIQIRADPHGCVQYDDLGGPSMLGDLVRLHGWLLPPLLIPLLLIAGPGRLGMSRVGLFWTGLAISVVAMASTWPLCRHFQKRMAKLPAGAIVDANAAYRMAMPWKKVEEIKLNTAGPQNYRLQIVTGVKPARYWVVDAEIRCSAEQAQELRELLEGWRQKAG